MARPKPWLKMWTEWVHDPKLISQTLAERGAWSLLLSLAQECDADGYIVKGNGSPMSVKDIASCLHITKIPDFHSFTSMLTKMENQGSLSWDEGCLFINNFAERQALKPSDTKEAARDRQRLHREKQSITSKPLEPTTPDTPHLQFALDLAKELKAELWLLPSFESLRLEHEFVREALMRIAKTRHYLYTQEMLTPRGRIDLVWSDPNHNPIAALEIDDKAPQDNSLDKLEAAAAYPIKIIILRRSSILTQLCANILVIGIKESNKEITPPLPIEREGEGEGEVTPKKGVTRHDNSVTLEPALAEITKLHEKNFSIITPFLAEKVKLFVENYHGPIEWIALAFAEAVKYKRRRWEYVEAILYSWQEKGGSHADRREPGGERDQPGAGRGDTEKSHRFGSFKAIESGPDEPDGGDED